MILIKLLKGWQKMTLIDIDQEIQFVYYDPEIKMWNNKTGSVKDLLQLFSAYQFLKVIDIHEIKWGSLEDYGKKGNLF